METRNFKTSFNLERVREDSGLMKLFMFHSNACVRDVVFLNRSLQYKSDHHAERTFFFSKKNAQNQRAKLIFWKWVKLLLYNFRLFQQVFENLKLNKLVKEERRLDLEARIWRLKFGKTQFWSCILKNEFESLYFWKASFHFFGVW